MELRRGLILFVSCAILALSLLNAHASNDSAMVSLKISPEKVRVGDEITLDIFIKHEDGFSLYLPDSIDLSPFEIIGTKVSDLKKEDGIFSQATFKMAVYKVGVFSIPSINLLLKSDTDRVEIKTPERQIEVVSILKTSNNKLLDIYPPLNIRQSYLKFLVYVWIVSLILIVATIFHFRKKRKLKREAVITEPKQKEDPKKAALELINKIFADDSLRSLNDKELCENVSFAIKYFIKEKFDVGSLEMTSRELVDCMHNIGLNEEYLKTTYNFLMACDMVKFANKPLYRVDGERGQNEIEQLKNYAISIIQV